MLDSKFLSLSVSKKKLKHFLGFQNCYGPSALWVSLSLACLEELKAWSVGKQRNSLCKLGPPPLQELSWGPPSAAPHLHPLCPYPRWQREACLHR